jgi:hypothetical protein
MRWERGGGARQTEKGEMGRDRVISHYLGTGHGPMLSLQFICTRVSEGSVVPHTFCLGLPGLCKGLPVQHTL